MKSINFKQSWYEVIAQFDAAVRLEIYEATLAYSLEGTVPEGMSDLARGAFAFIKADIDAARRRAEKAREARLARRNSEQVPVTHPGEEKPAATSAQTATRAIRGPHPKPGPKPSAIPPSRTLARAVERHLHALNLS